jgi:hypothetical protein
MHEPFSAKGREVSLEESKAQAAPGGDRLLSYALGVILHAALRKRLLSAAQTDKSCGPVGWAE